MSGKRQASKKLHETVVNLILELNPPEVLDLGSGRGALSLGLKRLNIRCVTTDLPLHDLNKESRIKGKYEVITCTEVVEHLYNPKKLLRDAYDLLTPGGVFIVTTPNSQNWFGRVFFMLTGKFPNFNGSDINMFEFEGHITPLFTWQFKMLIKDLFTIERLVYNRSVLPVVHLEIPIKNTFFGQNHIWVLKKAVG